MNGIPACQKLESVLSANPLTLTEKRCPICGKTKNLNCFHRDNARKHKVTPQCKDCRNLRHRTRYIRSENLCAEKNKKRNELAKAWRDNRPGHKEKRRNWNKLHCERIRETAAIWRKNNPVRVKMIQKRKIAKQLSTPTGRLKNSMSCRLRGLLVSGKEGRSWSTLVDFSLSELKSHLEKQFQEGMSWDNYGYYGWHIDHIIPVSVFNFETPADIDFKRCWALKNLRPMWRKQNQQKNAKLSKPFQPSLKI